MEKDCGRIEISFGDATTSSSIPSTLKLLDSFIIVLSVTDDE